VGLLVAKTLSNATANPFLAGGTGSYNPVVALDVFLVQARVSRGSGSKQDAPCVPYTQMSGRGRAGRRTRLASEARQNCGNLSLFAGFGRIIPLGTHEIIHYSSTGRNRPFLIRIRAIVPHVAAPYIAPQTALGRGHAGCPAQLAR